MTTIAYKDGKIAYDSQFTQDDVIKTLDAEKCVMWDGVRFFLTGPTCDYKHLIDDWFTGNNNLPDDTQPSCAGFVVDSDCQIWEAAYDGDGAFWKSKLTHPDTIGSGANFALAAMDMGASAEQAVRITAGRDIYTGGKIRVYEINQ